MLVRLCMAFLLIVDYCDESPTGLSTGPTFQFRCSSCRASSVCACAICRFSREAPPRSEPASLPARSMAAAKGIAQTWFCCLLRENRSHRLRYFLRRRNALRPWTEAIPLPDEFCLTGRCTFRHNFLPRATVFSPTKIAAPIIMIAANRNRRRPPVPARIQAFALCSQIRQNPAVQSRDAAPLGHTF